MSEDDGGSVTCWLGNLREGDLAAAQPLWERYFTRLVVVARGKLKRLRRSTAGEDEEDAALSAFNSFCGGAARGRFPQLTDRDDLWRLLVVITARKAMAQAHREGRKKRGGGRVVDEAALFGQGSGDEGSMAGLERIAGDGPSPEFAAIMAEECQRLLESLDDDSLRQVALSRMEGYTNDEIADQLGCAPDDRAPPGLDPQDLDVGRRGGLMATDYPEANAEDSLARDRAVNRTCERFEASWRAGERPRIADYLDSSDPAEHDALFPELLALEVELRRVGGESPGIDEYVGEFPDREAVVAKIFSELEPSRSSPHRTRDNGFPDDRASGDGDSVGVATIPYPHPAVPPEVSLLSTIGDYELIEEIARGGMGVVYRARHRGLKRQVALKMILSGSMATFEERERFLREAELAANLDHPSIVPIYEVGEHESRPFFSMKLVNGSSLAKQAGQFRDDPRAAARLVSTLARALHYAHGRGFLHCDLKPSNVLLDGQGKPYVTDFGLARRTGEDSSLSISGAILGTPSYMAPEQAAGSRARLGPATDVYGLGAILYELLTGRPPFRSPTIMETVVQVLERDPAPPRGLRPDVSRELEGICLKCLEKAPKDRYLSAEALAQELDNYLQGDGIAATGILSRLRRWNRREPELVARLGGLGLMAVITQINFYVSAHPDWQLHWTIQAVLGLWAILSLLFQVLLRTGFRSDRVRVLWSAADIVCLTIELKLLEKIDPAWHPDGPLVHVETTLLVGYPLLIAASGLWWRLNLVWITTLMAMMAFCWIYVDAALSWQEGHLSWRESPELLHPNIFLAGLFLTGYVVVRQVKRILALSRYYEHRPET